MTLNLSHLMPTLLQFLLYSLCFLPLSCPFTVIMSDSGVPSALIDGPQTGFSMNTDGAQTDPAEQEAVYDVMRATGNDWATDIPDVCRGRWHCIECMPDKDNVFHVVLLSFGELSDDTAFPTCDPTHSYISPSITKLPHLRTLFFYRCLTHNPQPIPSFLGRLGPSLQTLVLRENGHVGHVPTELGNLTRLRVLDLHKNNLNGSIPVSLDRLTGLWSLDLSSNILTGSIPGLSSPVLSIIDLSQNHLMGSIPPSISTCRSLIKMDLSRNQLTGSILRIIDQRLERSNAHGFELQPPLGPSSKLAEKLGFSPSSDSQRKSNGGVPHNSKRFVSRHEELDDLGSFQHELGRSNSIFTCPFAESPCASSRWKPLERFDSRKLRRAKESERAEIKRQFLNRARLGERWFGG